MRKNESPYRNFLSYLGKDAITIQQPFELTDIQYDQVKYLNLCV